VAERKRGRMWCCYIDIIYKTLAMQDILTYCTNGQTSVPLYADADRLLVLTPLLTSACMSKTYF